MSGSARAFSPNQIKISKRNRIDEFGYPHFTVTATNNSDHAIEQLYVSGMHYRGSMTRFIGEDFGNHRRFGGSDFTNIGPGETRNTTRDFSGRGVVLTELDVRLADGGEFRRDLKAREFAPGHIAAAARAMLAPFGLVQRGNTHNKLPLSEPRAT